MNKIQLELIFIAILTAISCALPGVFLLLRGVALMSDAISHSILLGIVLMFLVVQQPHSPLLIIGAMMAGLGTVICTEAIINTRRLKKDTAIGLVFPLFFSLGVLLISQYARDVHLDSDMVILGELAFAPFNRLILWGMDIGPYALWLLGAIFIMNSLFIYLFYKELQLVTFDQEYAAVLGFSPTVVYYGLMSITSLTAVGAFDIVGAIVVVALMIVPPATAYLLSKRLPDMIVLSLLLGIIMTLSGYLFAYMWDVSIAGSIATMGGIIFFVVFTARAMQAFLPFLLK